MDTRSVTILILFLVLASGSLGACNPSIWLPSPPPGTPTPLSVTIDSLLLAEDDLPKGWRQLVTRRDSESEEWRGLFGAVDAVQGVYENNRGGTVTYSVVRMDSSQRAESLWEALKNDRIEAAYTSYVLIQLLSDYDLPKLNADQVLLRCEHYTRDIKGCVVRLRYDLIYTEVKGDFTNDRISPTEFHQFLQAVDEKMKPIWSSNNQEYSPLVLP